MYGFFGGGGMRLRNVFRGKGAAQRVIALVAVAALAAWVIWRLLRGQTKRTEIKAWEQANFSDRHPRGPGDKDGIQWLR